MDYVLAQLKGKEERYERLYAGEALYSLPDNLDSAVKYDPARALDEDEWYKLEEFSGESFCIELLKRDFRSTDYAGLKKARTETIEYICSYQAEGYFFQRIFKQSIFMQKRLTIGEDVSLDPGEKSIVINNVPDAIYMKNKDVLYFKKLQTIAPIFKGIETLYKEATKEETEKFLKSKFIVLVNNYNVDKVKTMNRKRIAMAMVTLSGFDKKQKKDVLEYTHLYYPHLEYDPKKETFQIGSEDDMKYLLWGIEQRYYTTPITKEKRVANSVMKIEG